MPWTAGVFARLYGPQGWVNDRNAATGILATRADEHDQDLSDGINACIKKDGTNAATANLAFGAFRLTGVGNPVNAQDAATKAWVEAAAQLVFASGDQILWRGASTPTGWTVAAQNNKALRIVSGAPTSGGANAFTTALNSARSVAGDGTHTHTTGTASAGTVTAAGAAGNSITPDHTHAVNGAGTHAHTLNLDVQYYDMQIIQKT